MELNHSGRYEIHRKQNQIWSNKILQPEEIFASLSLIFATIMSARVRCGTASFAKNASSNFSSSSLISCNNSNPLLTQWKHFLSRVLKLILSHKFQQNLCKNKEIRPFKENSSKEFSFCLKLILSNQIGQNPLQIYPKNPIKTNFNYLFKKINK